MNHKKLLAALATVALQGCSCDMDLGRDLADAGSDAGTFTPRTDECGNGIDDDQNGRIDDGCWCGTGDVQSCFSGPYPGQGIGACRNGMQTCDVQEFGDWGAFACTGQTLPSTELCDAIDNDCDGAIDEDCPCPAGTSRMCSDEFAVAPCMPGTQTCRGGTWSRCEGAVVPSADICDDAIDNDCDGTTNEGCTCVSVPEVCGDGVDNDCDGDIDEVRCAPLPDAGMSTPDAGVDAPLPMSVDAGMPGPDAGACGTVDCTETCSVSSLRWSVLPSDTHHRNSWWDTNAVWTGSAWRSVVVARANASVEWSGTTFFLNSHDGEGALLESRRLEIPGSGAVGTPAEAWTHAKGLIWTGSALLMGYQAGGDASATWHLAQISAAGVVSRIIDAPPGNIVSMAWNGSTLAVLSNLYGMPGQSQLSFFDGALNATAAPWFVEPLIVMRSDSHVPDRVTWTGETWVVVGRVNNPSDAISLWTFNGAGVATESTLDATDARRAVGDVVLARGASRTLACWTSSQIVGLLIDVQPRCQYLLPNGMPDGAWVALPTMRMRQFEHLLLAHWDGAFILLAPGSDYVATPATDQTQVMRLGESRSDTPVRIATPSRSGFSIVHRYYTVGNLEADGAPKLSFPIVLPGQLDEPRWLTLGCD